MKQIDYQKLALVGIIIFLVALLYDLRQHNKAEVKRYQSAVSESRAQTEYLKTKLGQTVAEKEAAEVTSKQFIELYKKEAADLQKDFDVKIKNLRAFVRAEIQAKGAGVSVITNGNSAEELEFEAENNTSADKSFLVFNDGYLKFMSSLGEKEAVSNYTYTDTLTYSISYKKKWFLGKEKLYGNGMLSNKNAVITGSTDVLIDNHKDKRWAVTVGAYYDPFYGRSGLAIGVGYSLIKF